MGNWLCLGLILGDARLMTDHRSRHRVVKILVLKCWLDIDRCDSFSSLYASFYSNVAPTGTGIRTLLLAIGVCDIPVCYRFYLGLPRNRSRVSNQTREAEIRPWATRSETRDISRLEIVRELKKFWNMPQNASTTHGKSRESQLVHGNSWKFILFGPPKKIRITGDL